jgi:hypothetical protein
MAPKETKLWKYSLCLSGLKKAKKNNNSIEKTLDKNLFVL